MSQFQILLFKDSILSPFKLFFVHFFINVLINNWLFQFLLAPQILLKLSPVWSSWWIMVHLTLKLRGMMIDSLAGPAARIQWTLKKIFGNYRHLIIEFQHFTCKIKPSEQNMLISDYHYYQTSVNLTSNLSNDSL